MDEEERLDRLLRVNSDLAGLKPHHVAESPFSAGLLTAIMEQERRALEATPMIQPGTPQRFEAENCALLARALIEAVIEQCRKRPEEMT